jgi:hypothetical protein
MICWSLTNGSQHRKIAMPDRYCQCHDMVRVTLTEESQQGVCHVLYRLHFLPILTLTWTFKPVTLASSKVSPHSRDVQIREFLYNTVFNGSLDIKKTRHIACKQLGRLLEGNHLLIISPQGVFHCSKFFNKRNSSSSSQNDIANK